MKYWLLLITITCFLFSCSVDDNEDIIARVNDDVLTFDEFKAGFTETEWKGMDFEEKRSHLNKWINLTLLAQEADRTGISKTEELKNRIELATKNIKSNSLMAQKLYDLEISEEDLFSYYKLHKSKFQKETSEYRLQRIFIKEETKVDSVLNLLSEQKIKFTEAAKLFSEEIIGKDGGYTDFLGKEDMEKSIWDTIIKLDKWYYSTVEINQGYLIVRYYDTRKVYTEKTFTEVKQDLYEIVKKTKKQDLYESIIEDLKAKSEISISF